MTTVKNYAIPILLSPGVIVHELAHFFACVITGTKVTNLVLFRFENPPGYVEHETPRSYTKRLVIALAPLLFNTGLGVGLFAWSTSVSLPKAIGLIGLGTIILSSSIPSSMDAKSLLPGSLIGLFHPLFWLAGPLIAVLLLLNRWPTVTTLIYTVVVAGLCFLAFHTTVVPVPSLELLARYFENLLT